VKDKFDGQKLSKVCFFRLFHAKFTLYDIEYSMLLIVLTSKIKAIDNDSTEAR
jgi:hypothetical protein